MLETPKRREMKMRNEGDSRKIKEEYDTSHQNRAGKGIFSVGCSLSPGISPHKKPFKRDLDEPVLLIVFDAFCTFDHVKGVNDPRLIRWIGWGPMHHAAYSTII